jgi:hypothetical protein
MSQNGKGSKRRPCFVPLKEFDDKWDGVFKKKDKDKEKPKQDGGDKK